MVKTLQAIQDANVVIRHGRPRRVVEHDLNLLGFVLETGRALVIALNKWDGMEAAERDYVKTELERRLLFVDFADIHFISALHGTGVGHLYKSVQESFRSAVNPLADQPPDQHPRGRRAGAPAADGQRSPDQAALRPPGRRQSAADRDPRQPGGRGAEGLYPLPGEDQTGGY